MSAVGGEGDDFSPQQAHAIVVPQGLDGINSEEGLVMGGALGEGVEHGRVLHPEELLAADLDSPLDLSLLGHRRREAIDLNGA